MSMEQDQPSTKRSDRYNVLNDCGNGSCSKIRKVRSTMNAPECFQIVGIVDRRREMFQTHTTHATRGSRVDQRRSNQKRLTESVMEQILY